MNVIVFLLKKTQASHDFLFILRRARAKRDTFLSIFPREQKLLHIGSYFYVLQEGELQRRCNAGPAVRGGGRRRPRCYRATYGRDARFVPKIVMRRVRGGVAARGRQGLLSEMRDGCPDQRHAGGRSVCMSGDLAVAKLPLQHLGERRSALGKERPSLHVENHASIERKVD